MPVVIVFASSFIPHVLEKTGGKLVKKRMDRVLEGYGLVVVACRVQMFVAKLMLL